MVRLWQLSIVFCATLSTSACSGYRYLWDVVVGSTAQATSVSLPVIQNIRNNSVLQSGFVIGTASNVDGVEIAFDGGLYSDATMIGTNWKIAIPLPSSGLVWRDNSLHVVQARTRTNGLYSAITQLQFRKGVNHDINGDGYADLVVAAQAWNAAAQIGRSYIFYSTGSIGVQANSTSSSDVIITGEASGDNFGSAIVIADVDGDGYADVIISAIGWTSGSFTGRLYIFHSTLVRFQNNILAANASQKIDGSGSGETFGLGLAAGDINGDGYSDLVVGAYSYAGNQGRVYIFHSSGILGMTINTAAFATNIISNGAASEYFGYAVAVGDINGDNYSDVSAGGYGYNAGSAQGRVYIFVSAGPTGILITASASATSVITGESAGDGFGNFIGSADFNGDGFLDVAIGAFGYNAGAYQGRAYVFHSTGTGGITITNAASASTILTGESINDTFGNAMSTGDVNGDGYADIAVASSSYGGGLGRTYIFHSQGASGILTAAAGSTNAILTGVSAGAGYGNSISFSDLNGDGYSDLVIGAQSFSFSKGRVYVYNSTGQNGLTSLSIGNANITIDGENNNDLFGSALW